MILVIIMRPCLQKACFERTNRSPTIDEIFRHMSHLRDVIVSRNGFTIVEKKPNRSTRVVYQVLLKI